MTFVMDLTFQLRFFPVGLPPPIQSSQTLVGVALLLNLSTPDVEVRFGLAKLSWPDPGRNSSTFPPFPSAFIILALKAAISCSLQTIFLFLFILSLFQIYELSTLPRNNVNIEEDSPVLTSTCNGTIFVVVKREQQQINTCTCTE
jgi:hypothetical protein